MENIVICKSDVGDHLAPVPLVRVHYFGEDGVDRAMGSFDGAIRGRPIGTRPVQLNAQELGYFGHQFILEFSTLVRYLDVGRSMDEVDILH